MRVTHLFAVLFVAATAAAAEPKAEVKNSELRDELQKRRKVVQDGNDKFFKFMTTISGCALNIRDEKETEFNKLKAERAKMDADNAKWLGEQVDKTGWPTISEVGKEAARTAWLLVYLADANPKFQRKCLDLIAKLPKGEVDATDVADLTDKVLLAEGKKQVYGTQIHYEDGKWQPRPLEDEANVDKRRAEVGLPPLAEYIKENYGPSKK